MSNKHTNYQKYNKEKRAKEDVIEPKEDLNESTTEPDQIIGIDLSHGEDLTHPFEYKVTNCERLNVRKGPGKNFEPITVIDKNDIVKCVEAGEEWTHITTNEIHGYVMNDFITRID